MTPVAEPDFERVFMEALRRPTVIFDVDGVLACYTSAACEAVNGRFGTSYTPMAWWDYDGPFDDEHRAWLYAERHSDPAFWMAMAPNQAAIAALARLGEAGYVTRVWTNRPLEAQSATVAWADHYGVRATDGLHLFGSGGKVRAMGVFGPGNPAVLVDDNPARLRDTARPGVWVLAPRSPYLRDAEGYRHASVFDDFAQLPALVAEVTGDLWPT